MTTVDVGYFDRPVVVKEPTTAEKVKFLNQMPENLQKRSETGNLNKNDISWLEDVVTGLTDVSMAELNGLPSVKFGDLSNKVLLAAFKGDARGKKKVAASMTVHLYEDGEARISSYTNFE